MFSKPGSKKEVWLRTERQLTTPSAGDRYLIRYDGWGKPFALESSNGRAVPRTIASLPADAIIANPATPQKPTISSITASKTTVDWRIAGGQNAPTKFKQLTTTWANIKKQ